MAREDSKHGRQAPLDLAPEEFRASGHRLIDRIADLLAGMRDRTLTAGLSAPELRDRLDAAAGMPEEGRAAGPLLSHITELLIDNSLYNGHPKFLGYVTSSPAPIGMLGDLMAAAVNPNVGAWVLSPMATEIEAQTIRWIAELLGYPSGCSGLLVSGGNMANYVGLYAAVRSVFPRGTPAQSPERMAKATIYASSETHTWIEKAVDIFGFPPYALRTIPVDGSRRLRLEDLEARLAADLEDGCIPVAIVGSAGTVSTGAIDPLPLMAGLCRQHRVWFHVDGAYGGFAAMIKNVPDDLRGLTLADSVAVDPHKWLYAPLEAGCALVRDPALHRAAFSYHPPYYQFDPEVTNFVDYGPQNSRGFRALKVWLALAQAGRRGYEKMIADDIALARDLYNRLADHPSFEACTHSLSITTFRYVPDEYRGRTDAAADQYLNRLNEVLQARLEVGGELFVSNARMDGRYLLRVCIVNFRTSVKDIAEIPGIIALHGAAVHKDLQRA